MVPAGYLLKRVSAPPGWLSGAPIADVCSVADCVNDNVVDVQTAWQHNAFGVANDRETLSRMIVDAGAETDDAKLFYYEAYEQEIETDGWSIDPVGWRTLTAVPSAGVETSVVPPTPSLLTLIGYDVVVFGDYLEHSPLSCNSIAAELLVNDHCLFGTLEDAKAAIDRGAFNGGCEPGVYRIFSVSVVLDKEPDV
jgi:hypothetical protein